jgi:hypothetical protein
MDHGTVPSTTDQAEERVDDHERACRDPYADEETATEGSGVETADHVGVRSWVTSLFAR